jgi:hypothetical protein
MLGRRWQLFADASVAQLIRTHHSSISSDACNRLRFPRKADLAATKVQHALAVAKLGAHGGVQAVDDPLGIAVGNDEPRVSQHAEMT